MTAERPVADRPAAELLAEYDATEPGMWDRDHFRLLNTRDILVRLARAEQALDDLAKPHTPHVDGFCDGCGWPFPCLTVRAVRAALRASQEADRG